jgi:hypothetical protein
MGWFSPMHGFLAREDAAEEVSMFAPLGTPSTGRKKGIVSESEIKSLRARYGIACEIEGTDHLTAFDVGGESQAERALYTIKKIPGATRAGLVSIPLDAVQMARLNRLLGRARAHFVATNRSGFALNRSFTLFTSFTTRKPGYSARKQSFCTERMEKLLRIT